MSSAGLPHGIPGGASPERREPGIGWFARLGARAFGIVARRARAQVRRWERLVRAVNDYGPPAARLDEREIFPIGEELQLRLPRGRFFGRLRPPAVSLRFREGPPTPGEAALHPPADR